jgi:putative endonuclease
MTTTPFRRTHKTVVERIRRFDLMSRIFDYSRGASSYVTDKSFHYQSHSLKSCHPERSEGPMHPARDHMSNRSKTLYTGITNNLLRRVWEDKRGVGSAFCAQYKLDRLVYFERFQYVGNAITREKQIKGWLRIKKITLIAERNPAWCDLSVDWYGDHQQRQRA